PAATDQFQATLDGNTSWATAGIVLAPTPAVLTVASSSNQFFNVDDPPTAVSPITITDGDTPTITAANDIRITIPAGFNMTWDADDTTATIAGSDVSSTVTYEDSDATLVLDVTSDFAGLQSITVSDLSFKNFTAASTSDNLEVDVNNDATADATDSSTIQVSGATGTIYYVRKSGSDSNNGESPANAWLTIDKAANTMLAGDWVYVGAGVYDEQVTPANSGTASDPIRFVADTDGAQTGDAGTVEITESSGTQETLLVEAKDYIQFVGFKISSGLDGVVWDLASTNGLLEQCEVTGSADRGIDVNTDSTLTITDCDVHTITNEALYVHAGATATLSGTDLHDNGKYGMRINATTATIIASECRIYSNGGRHGIYMEDGSVTLTNCLLYDNDDGINLVSGGSQNLTLWHCTIDNNPGAGVLQDSGTSTITNCIITNNGGPGLDQSGGTMNHTESLVWNNNPDYSGTSAHATELSVDPLFVSAANRHLQSSSPAIDAGTDGSAVTTVDFDGQTRPYDAGWDMGYDEYDPAVGVVVSSDADQTFGVGDPVTAVSPITVTDAASPVINFIDDIRITIPSGFNMTWDTTDTEAEISGPGASNVSTTVTYEDADRTLVIGVTTSFSASDRIHVSGLSFTGFLTTSAADNLELDIDNDGTADATDDKSIQVGPSGNTYYVRTTGSDLADGLTPATAWQTIDNAAIFMSAGDWLYVGAGIYENQISSSNDGTAADPVRFIADTDGSRTGDAGTVEITDSTGTLDVLQITGNDYFEFIGFKITGGDIMARWENCVGGLLKDCELTGGDRTVRTYGTAELTISGCVIHTNTSSAVRVADSSTVTISDTVFHNNTGGVRDDPGSTATITLDRCEFYSHSKPSIYAFSATYTATNCLIHSNTSRGIGLEADGPTVTLWHCTIDNNQDEGILQQAGTSTIRNCIISNNGQTGIELVSGTSDHTYNLLWNNSPDYLGTVADATELSADPLFISAADRHLQSGSPAIDVGTNGSGMTLVDYDGDGRPGAAGWDMGYDEYGQATAGTPRIIGWREVEPW
ncbi:MAG: right-handed parallel beta-helix repeat-containing protein, partial [Planctomycetota bacterium]